MQITDAQVHVWLPNSPERPRGLHEWLRWETDKVT
jgi:hypothetical protein